MQFLEKLWKIWENVEILNLSQQKEEETMESEKLSKYKVFHRKFISSGNGKNTYTYE